MKESLQQSWKQETKKEASEYLKQWGIDGSGVSARTQQYRDGILAYYDFNGMRLGPMEGVNNRIKAMLRQAYGYRDKEFFELKIKASYEAKDAFSG